MKHTVEIVIKCNHLGNVDAQIGQIRHYWRQGLREGSWSSFETEGQETESTLKLFINEDGESPTPSPEGE